MTEVITIGVDLAKNVFQVHGVDAEGAVVVRRRLRRGQVLPFFKKQRPCLVGMEACATSHHWGREIEALGHQVRLMPPRYVKPYVKRNKNDMADAEAICEAVTRPTMRFVEIKTADQQSVLMLHRTRHLAYRALATPLDEDTFSGTYATTRLLNFNGTADHRETEEATVHRIGSPPEASCRPCQSDPTKPPLIWTATEVLPRVLQKRVLNWRGGVLSTLTACTFRSSHVPSPFRRAIVKSW